MKKIIIGLVTLGSIVSANATMLEINGPLNVKLSYAQAEEAKTYFETLGDLFTAGIRPDLSKISNIAWAGRCYLSDKPNAPTNAGYIFRQKRSSDIGSIGVSTRTYEAFSYWQKNKAPNYFDDKSLEQVFAEFPDLPATNIKINSNSVETYLSDLKSELKISGSYLVEELTRLASDTGPIGKSNAYGRCYYFIPEITNN